MIAASRGDLWVHLEHLAMALAAIAAALTRYAQQMRSRRNGRD